MKDTKRVIWTHTFYDRTGIEKYLERQAQKGWILEKIDSLFMVFRKSEARKLKFSAAYFPKASAFDSKPSQEQESFNDFCEHTGWKYVTSNAEMQIFYNENEDSTPIETDPDIEIQNIHKSMKKLYLPLYIILGIIYAFQMVMFIERLNTIPMETLSNNCSLFSAFCFMLVLIMLIAEIVSYYRWRGKALRLAENELFLETSRKINWYLTSIVFMLLGLVFLVASLIDVGYMYIAVIYVLVICIGGVGIGYITDIMKKHNLSTKINRAVCVLLAVLLTGVMLLSLIVIMDEILPAFDKKEAETYEYDGNTFEVYNDEIPLRIEDFMETDYTEYSTECSKSSSVFVDYIEATQKTRYDAQVYHRINYSVAIVKNALIYDICKELYLNDFINEYGIPGEGDSYWYKLVEVDSEPWGADSAYQIFLDDEPRNHCVLFYENHIVEIEYENDWELTNEQMSTIGEILNGY